MKRLLLFVMVAAGAAAADYFPPGSLASSEAGHKFRSNYYSSFLHSLGEEPMFARELPKKEERYRFTWLRTFNRPIVMRIEVGEASSSMIVKVSDGTGGFEPGKIVRDEKRELSSRDLEIIRALFQVHDFFALPSYDEKRIGADGSEWIIEALAQGRYHIVARWTPEEGAVRRIGMKLIEIAIGGDFTPIY